MVASRHTQAEANYGRGDPVSHCGICSYYQGMRRCSQVMGTISPYGVSDIFKALPNPFGKTLAPNEIKAIQTMAMDAADRSGG
jgi:hypothetical protein